MSDVHAVSETSWTESQIEALQAKMKDGGHRLWAVAAKTRNTTKSGTAISARATIAPRPGDGQVWAKPDGKAMAVALTHLALYYIHAGFRVIWADFSLAYARSTCAGPDSRAGASVRTVLVGGTLNWEFCFNVKYGAL